MGKIRLFFMNKRGISPLIATILIIGLTIVIAVLIFVWGGKFVRQQRDITSAEIGTTVSCVGDVSLIVKNLCYDDNNIQLLLENKAGKDITGFVFKIADNFSSYDDGLVSYKSSLFNATYVGEIPKVNDVIRIYPKIMIDDEERTCSYETYKIESPILPCNPPPSDCTTYDYSICDGDPDCDWCDDSCNANSQFGPSHCVDVGNQCNYIYACDITQCSIQCEDSSQCGGYPCNTGTCECQYPQGLISWYRAENDAIDIINEYDGQGFNGLLYNTGIEDYAFNFDNVCSYVQVEDQNDFDFSTGSFTIEAWVKKTDADLGTHDGAGGIIVAKKTESGNDAQTAWSFFVEDINTLKLRVWNTDHNPPTPSQIITSSTVFSDSQKWYYITVTYNTNGAAADSAQFYVDGSPVTTTSPSANILNIEQSTHPLVIGGTTINGYTDSYCLNGSIDNLKIWNKVLTPQEISAAYDAMVNP